MNKNQLETDLRYLLDSIHCIIQKVQTAKQENSLNCDDLILMLVGIETDLVRAGSHQDVTL
ncbi:MAG: hypothetical protein K2Z81_07770 [Cyanobacteria bacterium]|nr:hypothetical protein [Cyanobacteriota bacterium]